MVSTSLILGLGLFMLLLIFLRLEVAFAIGTAAILWMYMAENSLTLVPSRVFGGLNMFVLLAIPFFLLAGELMNQTGITDQLVRFANVTIGRVRGGLAQANVVASLFFAGITGAAVADVAALGRIFVPAMAKEGYPRDFSAAVTAASSLVGPIIPPSIIIVIYGAVTQTSIGGLFAAAVVPGLILSLSLMLMLGFISVRYDLPRYEADIERSEYPNLLVHSVLAMTMPAIILFGITGGIFTPTEAAAVACVYALFLGIVVYRSLSFDGLYESLRSSVLRTSQLYLIIGFATILSWLLAIEQIPALLAETIGEAGLGVVGFMLVIALVLLFVGTWLEIGAAAIILGPTLADMAALLGIHEFQFGIMMIVTLNFGLITPPVGICLFAASSVSRAPVISIAKKIMPFFVADIAVLLLIIQFPQLTLWLPRLLGY